MEKPEKGLAQQHRLLHSFKEQTRSIFQVATHSTVYENSTVFLNLIYEKPAKKNTVQPPYKGTLGGTELISFGPWARFLHILCDNPVLKPLIIDTFQHFIKGSNKTKTTADKSTTMTHLLVNVNIP